MQCKERLSRVMVVVSVHQCRSDIRLSIFSWKSISKADCEVRLTVNRYNTL